MERTNAWKHYREEQLRELTEIGERYKAYISTCKTERECTAEAISMAKANGYRDLAEIIANQEQILPGDKVYAQNMGKAILLLQIGTAPMEQGMNIVGAHIDSPRLDIKPNPLYEEAGMAYLDTHYYGGIKKYQWTCRPLALHGTVAKKDGTKIEIAIGEDEHDPVFGVTELLVHLSGEMMKKQAAVVIEGENLDILVGSRPVEGDGKDLVRQGILNILHDTYGMEEEDFLSAELEMVPAGKARDFGFDRSMIMGYAQDDRVCAYTALEAMMRLPAGSRTAACLLVDKEEIGSVGATGMQSAFFEDMVAEVLERMGCYSELALRRTLRFSRVLSADVSVAFDPLYASAMDAKNSAYFGKGPSFNKYVGSRGKGGSNDANAEYIALLRGMLDRHQVAYQFSEIGKVDQGGGGTIAYILAKYGMQVIDCGVPVLNMHAPWEITSKADVYEAVKAFHVFLAEG